MGMSHSHEGAAIWPPGRHGRGAAHPSDPPTVNWAASHTVLFFKTNDFLFLFMYSNFYVY
jgi:hypothetical protein